MGIASFASRRTEVQFTTIDAAGELTIASGNPVQVCGIVFVAGTNNTLFTITNDGTTVLFRVKVLAASTVEASVPWLADAGLRIQADDVAGVTADGTRPSVVVFHNSPGN